MNNRIEMLKKFLEENPSDSFSRYALALEFIALNEKENAYDRLVELISEDPNYLPSYYIAGKTAEELGKNPEALTWYAKGIEIAKSQNNQQTLGELSGAFDLLSD